MNARKEQGFLNGVPELLLLRLLSRQPMHGYQLVQAIKLATGSSLEFGEGSIYPVLHRLEADGAVRGKEQAVNGRNRVVYRLTPSGAKRLAMSVANWERVAAAVATVLKGGRDGSPALA
jgi:PadR family transcriptional regulator PadR